MKKWQKISLLTGIIVLLIAALGVTGVSIYVGWNLTHAAREPVVKTVLADGLNLEDVSFPAKEDNITLKGWFLASPGSNRTIIFMHGYNKNRLQDDVPGLPVARALNARGFHVLTFDLRSNGDSEGEMTSLGLFEKRDLLGAIDFVRQRGKAGEHIAVMSWSMGAATTLNALADFNPGIEALVSDAAYSDLRPFLKENMSGWTNLPNFPFTPIILTVIPPVNGIDLDKVRPIDGAAKTEIPILFIHGGGDVDIPKKHSEAMVKVAKHPDTSLWIVPGATHVKSYETQPEEYLKRVTGFFEKYVGK